jgi:two-component system response regulator DesR
MTETGPGGCDGDGGDAVIRVLIAEDARVVRETLVALLSLEDDIEVAATLAAGDQIVAAALEHRPDVALLDIGLPGVDGITAAAELSGRLPGCRVLILTGLDAPGNLTAALAAGVSGYLLKDGPAEGLIRAIRAVADGERVIDARLAR